MNPGKEIRYGTHCWFPHNSWWSMTNFFFFFSDVAIILYSLLLPHPSVNDVIPLLVESHEIHIEHPLARSSGQTMILKTSHLCQWLESVASFYTTLTAQRLLLNRGTCVYMQCLYSIISCICTCMNYMYHVRMCKIHVCHSLQVYGFASVYTDHKYGKILKN